MGAAFHELGGGVLVDIAKTAFVVCTGNHFLARLVPFNRPMESHEGLILLGFQELVARLLKRFDCLRNDSSEMAQK